MRKCSIVLGWFLAFSAACGSSDPAPCGNGLLDPGEACDPEIAQGTGTCPSDCDDGNACTQDTTNGSAQGCDAACENSPITQCQGGDGCCPAGCDCNIDNDCEADICIPRVLPLYPESGSAWNDYVPRGLNIQDGQDIPCSPTHVPGPLRGQRCLLAEVRKTVHSIAA